MSQSKKTILFNPDLLSTGKNKNKTIKKKNKTYKTIINKTKQIAKSVN